MNDPMVSGTARGAERDITGSAYFVQSEDAHNDAGDPVAKSITGFSVSSPQRASHLNARSHATTPTSERTTSITGTFAQGDGKITGNVEFLARSRTERSGSTPARRGVTGEGAVSGPSITGSAWSENTRVTGTEDVTATTRNPSQQGGQGHGFAGTTRFAAEASAKTRTSHVTGAVGWTPTSGAAVTLSGGAAG